MPNEIQFINFAKPSQHLSQGDLSRIKSHAMRSIHRRRRLGQMRALQAQSFPDADNECKVDLSPTEEPAEAQHRNLQTQSRRKTKPGLSSVKELDVEITEEVATSQSSTSREACARNQSSDRVETKPPPADDDKNVTDNADQSLARSGVGKMLAIHSADMVFGGTRKDPFQMYPIKAQEYFPAAVDFLQEVVAAGPSFIRFVMSHDVMFEAIMTYVLCVMPNKNPEKETAMMYHYGGTLSKINAQLLATGEAGDAVLGAIGNLAVICAYYGDTACFKTHRKAISCLLEMRGGRHVLESDQSWARALLPSLDALAANHQGVLKTDESTPKSSLHHSLGSVESTHEPVYPTHPIPNEVSIIISGIPEGFRQLASDGSLSLQVIRRLGLTRSQIVQLMATAKMDRDHWHRLLPRLTPLERLIWLAILVVYLRGSTYVADCQGLAEAVLECFQDSTKARRPTENECIMWGACVIVAAPDPESKMGPQRESIIQTMVRRQKMSLEQIHEIVRNYLWIDSLGANLDKVVGPHLAAKSR